MAETDPTTNDLRLLHLADARKLAPLLADYAQAMKRGAPRRPDEFYAEQLLQDRNAELLGSFSGDTLAGFCIFYDLPEPISGARYGMCDHIYVREAERYNAIGSSLIERLKELAGERSWRRLMLLAPREPKAIASLFETLSEPADWSSHVIRF